MLCGDAIPVSSGACANNKTMVTTGDEERLKALNHNFHTANTTPSVTLLSNIPLNMSRSFFVGDKGQTHVTLKESMVYPSEVFDHCGQLIDALNAVGQKLTVRLLQTDGGPDHSLKRVAGKFALITTFQKQDLDHPVAIWCASTVLLQTRLRDQCLC